jgi:hypothetical protein
MIEIVVWQEYTKSHGNFDWRHVERSEVGQSSGLAADEMRAISSISSTVVLSSSLTDFIELEP